MSEIKSKYVNKRDSDCSWHTFCDFPNAEMLDRWTSKNGLNVNDYIQEFRNIALSIGNKVRIKSRFVNPSVVEVSCFTIGKYLYFLRYPDKKEKPSLYYRADWDYMDFDFESGIINTERRLYD